jgi:glycine betaine transporter
MSLSLGSYNTSETFTRMDRLFIGLLASLGSVHWGFIARISKGRTIKEFLITTIFIPSVGYLVFYICKYGF